MRAEPRDVAALLLALPAAQNDHMPRETLETLCNGLQVGSTLGYNDGRAASFQRMQDIIEYEIIARFIGDHFLEDILDGRRRDVQWGLELEVGIPDLHHVIKWTLGRLGSCIHAMTNGATLHNDDRVMSIFSRNRC